MDWFEKEKKQRARSIISRRLRDFDETLRACFAEDADAEALLHAERRATTHALLRTAFIESPVMDDDTLPSRRNLNVSKDMSHVIAAKHNPICPNCGHPMAFVREGLSSNLCADPHVFECLRCLLTLMIEDHETLSGVAVR